ncbi:MAG: NrtR DNA-binding winged helix domain-containing protein, partial [Pseudomonadales bacterium]
MSGTALQSTVEAILGQGLHKQNFRRALERTGFVE